MRTVAAAPAAAARDGRPRRLALVAIVLGREDVGVAAGTDPVARVGASSHHLGKLWQRARVSAAGRSRDRTRERTRRPGRCQPGTRLRRYARTPTASGPPLC
jgi:hypothetical protein